MTIQVKKSFFFGKNSLNHYIEEWLSVCFPWPQDCECFYTETKFSLQSHFSAPMENSLQHKIVNILKYLQANVFFLAEKMGVWSHDQSIAEVTQPSDLAT